MYEWYKAVVRMVHDECTKLKRLSYIPHFILPSPTNGAGNRLSFLILVVMEYFRKLNILKFLALQVRLNPCCNGNLSNEQHIFFYGGC